MWLFTTRGFFSITQSIEDPTVMQVRARERQDLQNVLDFTGIEAEIVETPRSDYRYRIFLAPHTAAGLVMQLAADITYSNFKGAIARQPDQAHKEPGLHRIWSIHHQWQVEEGRDRQRRSYGELFDREPEPEWLRQTDEPWEPPTPIAGECPACRTSELMHTGATGPGEVFCPTCGAHIREADIIPTGEARYPEMSESTSESPCDCGCLQNPQQRTATPASRLRLHKALREPKHSDAEVRAVYERCRSAKTVARVLGMNINTVKARVLRGGWAKEAR